MNPKQSASTLRQVNAAVPYHALKSHVVELLAGDDAPEMVLKKHHALSVSSSVICRPSRASQRGT
jgi:hypothetical protein